MLATAVVAGCGSAALVEVPDVTEMPADQAQAELEDAGFGVIFDPESDDPAACTVEEQDETGEVEPGLDVILTLSCLVEVPDVAGMSADEAQSEIEAVGLSATLDPEPDDPALCTVEDQDETGDVEPGIEVILTLACLVEVQDVTGMDAEAAVSEIEGTGELTATWDPEPDDPTLCTVEDQDETGEVEPDTEVVLRLACEAPDVPEDEGEPLDPGLDYDYDYDSPRDDDEYDYDPPSYDPPDRDCGDYSYGDIPVGPNDPHGLDHDGDGIGCE